MTAARAHRPDYAFFILIAVMALFGLLMVLSAGQVQSYQVAGNGYHYFLQQIEALGIGLVGFYLVQRVRYDWWKKLALPLLILSLVLLALVFVPGIGFSYGGATRWINLGLFPLQASEIAKLALVIYLATWLTSKGADIRNFRKGVLPFFGVTALMGLLIMLEPDMGTTSIILMIALVMFFTAGAAVRHIGILVGSALGAMVLLIAAAPYRINRLLTFLDPTKDTLGTGYHVQQALVAIGSGGLFGLGFNNSIQKHFFLPEPMNDSIFAVIGEELGFVTAALVIAAFAYLAVRGFRIARRAPDAFSRLLVTGIITWVVWQAMINIAAMLSLVPLTGVPLPFISYGGSSLVVLMVAMGIVYNISKYTVKHREEEHVRILVAGGGTGGHVVPALAVSAELRQRGANVRFVGTTRPEDRRLVEAAGFPFTGISTGKFRRYFSLETLFEPFRVWQGYRQSRKLLQEFRPDVVFAKGGYAAVPVMRAAKRAKVPIVLHESDVVPGLANRIGARYAAAIAVSFDPKRMSWKTKGPIIETGNPLRAGVTGGKAESARRRFGLAPKVSVVLAVGGSQGAKGLNQLVWDALPELLPEFQVVHQVGKRWMREAAAAKEGLPAELAVRYHPQGFFDDELFDLYAAADVVVSRAGAGGLAELAATGNPSVLVPLPSAASDHQRANARVFEEAKAALLLDEERTGPDGLARAVAKLLHDPTRRSRMSRAAKSLAKPGATSALADLVWRVGKEGHA